MKLDHHQSKLRLLNAALQVFRQRGYAGTTVDDVCLAAGLTKGSFFHHFKSKEELAIAAAAHWSQTTAAVFEAAPYHQHADPLDRLLGYIDFRRSMLQGRVAEFTCLVGTLVQEVFDSDPAIRRACEHSIRAHAQTVALDIAQAMKAYKIKAKWSAESLALHTQAVLQGAFILAKTQGSAQLAIDSVDHLRRYVELLFKEAARSR